MNLDKQPGYQFNYDLFRSENTFFTLLDKFQEAFFIVAAIRNISGHITDFIFKKLNESGSKIVQGLKEEISGQSFLKLFPHPKESTLFENMCTVVENGVTAFTHVEIESDFQNNSRKFFDVRIEKFNDGCLLIFSDITKIKKLTTELKENFLQQEKLDTENSILKESLKIERESFHIALNDLYEAKEYFRIMGEAIPYGIWMSEPDGRIKYVSPSFLELLNMSLEEIKQFGWFHRLASEDIKPTLKTWQNCLRTGQPWESEYRIIGKDEKYHTVLSRGHPVYDEEDKIKVWVGIHLDIDDRIKNEEQLRIRESHLLNAETLANLGNYQIEMPSKIFNWSKGLCRIFGLDSIDRKSDLNDFLNFVHPGDRIYLKACIGQMLYLKTPLENTFRSVLPDGSLKYIRNMGKPVIDNHGNLTSIFGVMMDITELKLAELQIKKQKTYAELVAKVSRVLAGAGFDIQKILNILVEQTAQLLGDGCVIRLLSDDGKTITPAACYHHNKEVLKLINSTFAVSPKEASMAYELKVIESGKPFLLPVLEYENIPKESNPYYSEFLKFHKIYSVIIVPLKVYEKSLGSITMFRDYPGPEYKIEDLSLLQQLADIAAITILNARLHQNVLYEINERKKTVVELEKTLVKLERSNRELEQFAYIVSHDLQEPTRMVGSYSALLEKRYRNKLDQDANDFIQFIIDGSKRMQMLISDLLKYSRVTTETKPMRNVNCDDILVSVLTDLQIEIKEKNGIIKADPLPVVYGDPIQLRQLFQNLISNAIKFNNEERPEVIITCSKKQSEWCFSFKDNGIGINPEFFEKVFIIFQRLHDREQYPGTGIGLAICKKIVKNHGGNIWIESETGQGSDFIFTIPFKDFENLD